jgi:hypothetical protein
MTASGNGHSVSFPGTDDPGRSYTGQPGSYTVAQSADLGYTTSHSTECRGTLQAGDDVTCVINDDIAHVEPITPGVPTFVVPPKPPPTTPVGSENSVHSAGSSRLQVKPSGDAPRG